MVCFLWILTFFHWSLPAYSFIFPTQTSSTSSLTQMTISKSVTQTRGVQRQGPGWTARSRLSCFIKCKKLHHKNCTGFMFNPDTKLCTPVASFNDTEPMPTPAEGHLYLNKIICDKSKGLTLYPGTFGDPDICFGFFNTPLTYAQADKECKKKEAFLLSLQSAKKMGAFKFAALIFSSLPNWNKNPFWIGCDDIETEGTFVWKENNQTFEVGTAPDYFVADNQSDTKDCVYTDWNELFVESCDIQKAYSCEIAV